MNNSFLLTGDHGRQVAPSEIMQLGMEFCKSKILLSAVELGVFTELAVAGPLDSDMLRERLGLHPRGACDFFDALVGLGMLEREEGRYSNTPATDLFLDRAKPSYVGSVFEMINSPLYDVLGSLTEGLRTGLPYRALRSSGSDLLRAPCDHADPVGVSRHATAMTALSVEAARVIATDFPWQDYKSVIDIGCGQGVVPVQVALAQEHIVGGGFDLSAIEPIFSSYVVEYKLAERLTFTAGDLFDTPFPVADVLVMGHVLRNWDIEVKRLLLRKACEALPDGGALIIYDAIIDDERRNNVYGLLMSLNALMTTVGGFEYTGAACRSWMREAGFRKSHTRRLTGHYSMVIGIK